MLKVLCIDTKDKKFAEIVPIKYQGGYLMKCIKCGQSIPEPEFPEFKNWKEFMNKKLKQILNKENNNASQNKNNQT